MAPLRSIAGRSLGKLLEGFKTSTLGQGFGSGGSVEGVKATGGIKFEVGLYTYHYYLYSGSPDSFTANQTLGGVNILVVGGGGGGADGQAGGGGGSSVAALINSTLPLGTYPLSVGGGGATGVGVYNDPGDGGGNSTFSTLTVYGGGGGIKNNYGTAGGGAPTGGNSGGGGGGSLSGPSVTANSVVSPQPGGPLGFTVYGGYNGAPAANVGGGSGGGGGGAGGASPGPGPTRPDGTKSPGGPGIAIPQFPGPGLYAAFPAVLISTLGTSWRDAVGPTGLFGGGGGGGDDGVNGGGDGGPGGGGRGGTPTVNGTAGVHGTGGGGGGRAAPGSPDPGGGGNGIIIIYYPSA